jgi:hypothetical protein
VCKRWERDNLVTQYNCTSATLSSTQIPPSGELYFWQTSTTGTSTAISAANNYVVSAGGLYYLRAQNTLGCWSNASASASVSALNTIDVPQIAVQSCIGNGAISFTISNPSSYNSYKWYDSSNNLLGSDVTQSVTANIGTQVNCSAVLTNNANCSTTKPVTGYAYNLPVISSTSNNISRGGAVLLWVNQAFGSTPYSTIHWFNEGIDITGANPQILIINQPGNYIVEVGMPDITSTLTSAPKAIVYTVQSQTDKNYVISRTILQDNVANEAAISALPIEGVQETIGYFDGFGRPIQTVVTQGSPSKKDIVQPMVYDVYGRDSVKYLPYTSGSDGIFKANALSDPSATATTSLDKYKSGQQYLFYQNQGTSSDQYPYSKTLLESSPLNRVFEQGAPGAAWQPLDASLTGSGHTQKMDYLTNNTSEVMRWDIVNDTVCQQNNTFDAGQLIVTQITDENGNKTKEYKDKEGHVLLKKTYNGTDCLQTYYVYDDYGLLRYVLPPKAIDGLGSTTTLNPSTALTKQLCYYYQYDSRNRMIIKQLSGADKVYMVYDKRDRVVLTQDGEQRKLNKWLFAKYDELNRAAVTGLFTYGSKKNQSEMQAIVDGVYSGTAPRSYFVVRNNTTETNYADGSFPKASDGTIENLTATMYDTYGYQGMMYFDDAVNVSGYSDTEGTDTRYFEQLKGMITGTVLLKPAATASMVLLQLHLLKAKKSILKI